MKIKKGISLEEENGEAILFDRESLLTAWLNETSILIWKDLREGKNSEAITLHLQEIYQDLSPEAAQEDVRMILKSFQQYGFIEDDKNLKSPVD